MKHPFGCSVFPCLTPYNQHKLQYHSQLCLFIGYSDSHKGFKCMASSGRIYISRHVIFNHKKFPYQFLFVSSNNTNTEQKISLLPLQFNPNHIVTYSADDSNLASHASEQSTPLHRYTSSSTTHNSPSHFSDSSSTKYMLPDNRIPFPTSLSADPSPTSLHYQNLIPYHPPP